MTLLRQKLDEILTDKCIRTPPESTPCWKLISELFTEVATRYPDLFDKSITIMFHRETNRPVYELRLVEMLIVKTAFVNFTFDEVQKCIELAHYNFIKVEHINVDKRGTVPRILSQSKRAKTTSLF